MSATLTVTDTASVSPLSLPRWEAPKVTEAEVEWADILTVDLSLYDTNKNELIQTVEKALSRDGFFYVVGHGISPETVSTAVSVYSKSVIFLNGAQGRGSA